MAQVRRTQRRVEQAQERRLHVTGGRDGPRGVGFSPRAHLEARAVAPSPRDALHRCVGQHLAAHRLQAARERLRQRPGTAFRPPRAVLVDHRLPADEVARGDLLRRRPRLRRQPVQRRADRLALERLVDHAPVRAHQLARGVQRTPHLARPGVEEVAPEHGAKDGPGLRRLEERLEDALVQLPVTLDKFPVGVRVVRGHGGDARAGLFQVAVKGDALVRARHGIERPGVHLDVLQAVPGEVQFRHDRRGPEHDVRAAAHVELVARHDFFRADRPADDRAAFEHQHPAARLGEIASADEPVVARADDDAIIGGAHGGKVTTVRLAGAHGGGECALFREC